MSDQERHRKSGGRAARQATRKSAGAQREAYLVRTIKPYELASEEVLALLEHNADTILEEIGVEIRDYPSAIERLRTPERMSMGRVCAFRAACVGRSSRPVHRGSTSSTHAIR